MGAGPREPSLHVSDRGLYPGYLLPLPALGKGPHRGLASRRETSVRDTSRAQGTSGGVFNGPVAARKLRLVEKKGEGDRRRGLPPCPCRGTRAGGSNRRALYRPRRRGVVQERARGRTALLISISCGTAVMAFRPAPCQKLLTMARSVLSSIMSRRDCKRSNACRSWIPVVFGPSSSGGLPRGTWWKISFRNYHLLLENRSGSVIWTLQRALSARTR